MIFAILAPSTSRSNQKLLGAHRRSQSPESENGCLRNLLRSIEFPFMIFLFFPLGPTGSSKELPGAANSRTQKLNMDASNI